MPIAQLAREKADTPSNFCAKLRKHVRNRRLEAVRQLGVDRIVDFTFGLGDTACHLILELFSQGNVVLTDAGYVVLTLLRSHRDDAKDYVLMPRHPYPLNKVQVGTVSWIGCLWLRGALFSFVFVAMLAW